MSEEEKKLTTKEIGDQGEVMALQLLVGKGYAIEGRNVRIGHLEMDILCRHGNRLVAVEVKSRRADHLDEDYGLNKEKIRHLAQAASAYVKSRNLPHEVQIDAILITNYPDGRPPMVEHLEDIALPPRKRRR